jgi:hypothetical protein
MYSKDLRTRVSTYDRMRADQEKINALTNKMREMKHRLKEGNIVAARSTSPVRDTKRGRSMSPGRTLQNFDLIDANSFR